MNNKAKTVAGWVALAASMLITVCSVVYAYGKLNQRQDTQEKSVITLKDEGCKPARELDKTVAVMQKGIETIEARQLEDRETLTIILEEVRK